ncbi:MAG: sodium/proton-translocating pyrophosphatase, partial [Actinomycetota bacterium]
MSPVRLLAQEASAKVEFGSGETLALFAIMLVCLLALLVAFILVRQVLRADQGTDKMREIARAIQEGSRAYLNRQFRTLAVFVVLLFFLLLLLEADSSSVRIGRSIAFLVGATFSALAGYTGMQLAVRANVRVAAAADRGGLLKALPIAFRAGGVAGMFVVGLGLLGAAGVVLLYQGDAASVLFGLGFGAALLAMFMRVGGGIFTKAADVGADLVGKVEQSIPEDDPRNAATIADNVGDNVGDCAGMAADLFESFAVTLVASIILGVSAFRAIGFGPADAAKGLIFPLAVVAVGLLASMVGIFVVKGRPGETNALKAINRGIYVAQVLAVIGAAAIAFLYVGNDKGTAPGTDPLSNPGARMFGAIVAGVVLGFAASKITQYFTSTETEPVREIAKAARTGPATTVLEGISSGLESAVWALIAIAVAIGAALMLGGGNIAFSLYLVALTGIGMLATTAIVVAEDTFGPVAD